MSDDIVTFRIRCEKALFELKVKSPIDVSVFVTKLVSNNKSIILLKNNIIN